MGNLDARTFWEQFNKKICDPNGMAPDSNIPYREIYTNDKPYTNLINKYLVPKILENNGLSVTNEYYRFDVAGWKQRDIISTLKDDFKQAGLIWHSWTLEVAFEHENDPKKWIDEAIKVLYAICPLKVVICYNDASKREGTGENYIYSDKHKLELLADVIKHLKDNFKIDVNGQYLIIIGNSNNDGYINKKGEEYFGYKAYLYDNNKNAFKKIK